MRFDYDEVMTRWWLDTHWDRSVSAGVNLRRFRYWWSTEEVPA